MITLFTYSSIIIIMIAVFILTLNISRALSDKNALNSSLKGHKSVMLNNNQLSSGDDGVSKNTRDVLKKIQSLDLDLKKKETFISQLKYKINYLYDQHPMRQYFILILKCICVIFTGLYFLVSFAIGLKIIIAILAGMILSVFVVNSQYNKKIANFLDNFVYAMDLIARGVKSGLSINDCFLQIVNDSEPVVSEQFLAITNDFRLGLSTEQVMDRFMKRMDLKEVHFFCLSIMIQQKTGGNLAEVILNLSKILRNRKSMILKIKTLSSEAKTSAMIMGSLPIGVSLLLSLVAPDYMVYLTNTTNGQIVIAGCAVWMSIGALVMRSMINFYR